MATRVFWFIGITRQMPGEITKGVCYSSDKEATIPNGGLLYALLCKTAAESDIKGRENIAQWYSDSGVSEMPTLVPIDVSSRRLTRKEARIARGLVDGDVLVLAFFVSFRANDVDGRAEAVGFIEEIIFRKAWEFWR